MQQHAFVHHMSQWQRLLQLLVATGKQAGGASMLLPRLLPCLWLWVLHCCWCGSGRRFGGRFGGGGSRGGRGALGA